LGDTSVSKTKVFARPKHLKVFDTLVFLETEVFTEYFKITLMPNGALVLFPRPSSLVKDNKWLVAEQYIQCVGGQVMNNSTYAS
jgi:hypothetical protein